MLDGFLHAAFPTGESCIIKLSILYEILLKAYWIGTISAILSVLFAPSFEFAIQRIILIKILYVSPSKEKVFIRC